MLIQKPFGAVGQRKGDESTANLGAKAARPIPKPQHAQHRMEPIIPATDSESFAHPGFQTSAWAADMCFVVWHGHSGNDRDVFANFLLQQGGWGRNRSDNDNLGYNQAEVAGGRQD